MVSQYTCIVVYTKGKFSERQDSIGVPYVDIEGPYTDNIQAYLNEIVGKDFWKWLDTVDSPKVYDTINVFFRHWKLRSYESGSAISSHDRLENERLGIIFPESILTEKFEPLNELGWFVHQGLRTGCNEVFYLNREKNARHYTANITIEKKKIQKNLEIESTLVIPAIRHPLL